MKEFLKNVSIYGVLPVLGKFSGFLLLPIYSRVFSTFEFGVLELIIALISFLVYFCSLEIYTAIGRYFYEDSSERRRRVLISTGLWLTIFSTLTVVAVLWVTKDILLQHYLNGVEYLNHYRVGLIWLILSAISTYLSVLPRYDKKPRLFVIISSLSLLIRLGCTIVFIIFFDSGIIGVIYGHIAGTASSTLMYGYISKTYLAFTFDSSLAKKISKFALPIVPGVLIIGFWQPFSRNLIGDFFTIAQVGIVAFALRITSLIQMLNTAVKLAWSPMLFENSLKPGFKADVKILSGKLAITSLILGMLLTLFGREVSYLIGTSEFIGGSVLIGFFVLNEILNILVKIRGFGPLLDKNTKILTIGEISGIILGITCLYIFKDHFGLIGIGLAFLLPGILKYGIIVGYTVKTQNISFLKWNEILIFFVFLSIIALTQIETQVSLRFILALLILMFGYYNFKKA